MFEGIPRFYVGLSSQALLSEPIRTSLWPDPMICAPPVNRFMLQKV